MAFRPENLSALVFANGFTLWHYRSTDVANDIDTAGYFNRAANVMRVGDFILVNCGAGGVNGHGLMVVTTSTPTLVDASNMTAFATVNSD